LKSTTDRLHGRQTALTKLQLIKPQVTAAQPNTNNVKHTAVSGPATTSGTSGTATTTAGKRTLGKLSAGTPAGFETTTPINGNEMKRGEDKIVNSKASSNRRGDQELQVQHSNVDKLNSKQTVPADGSRCSLGASVDNFNSFNIVRECLYFSYFLFIVS